MSPNLTCVSMTISVFNTHLNVWNLIMYATATLYLSLLLWVLYCCQNTAQFYWCLHTSVNEWGVTKTYLYEHDYIGIWHTSECAELNNVRNCYIILIVAALGALLLPKYCSILLMFAYLCKRMRCHQNLLVWAWLHRYLTHIWMCGIK